jgi:hypothetical protein
MHAPIKLFAMHGAYYDPKHGGCLRTVSGTGPYTIHGAYGADEASPYAVWTASMRVSKKTATEWQLLVDFAGKPLKPDRLLTAVFDVEARTIAWQDGNVWTPLYWNASQGRALAGMPKARARPPCS